MFAQRVLGKSEMFALRVTRVREMLVYRVVVF